MQIVDVRIKRVDLPEANMQAIYRRMQTERQRQAAEFRAEGEGGCALPYEPGRDAFASLSRTAEDLSALADGVEELPPNPEARSAVLAHLERRAVLRRAWRRAAARRRSSASSRAGRRPRGTLEAVGEEVLALVRDGTPPEQIGIVCPSLDRCPAPLETVFGCSASRTPRGPLRLAAAPLGQRALACSASRGWR